MLVLTRKISESIVINGDIEITVVGVDRNGQVRLGVQAPRRYPIYRKEVLEAIEAENRQALASEAALQALAGLTLPSRRCTHKTKDAP